MLFVFGIIFSLAVISCLLYVIYNLSYSMIRGGPYAAIGEQKIADMLRLAQVKKGDRSVDIGAGDGRIVIAFAKAGAEAHGYEINPLLVWIARRNIKNAGLEGSAFIHRQDFWSLPFTSYNIVTVYLAPHIMKSLEKKLQQVLAKGTKVLVNYYHFPRWKPEKTLNTVFLYKK